MTLIKGEGKSEEELSAKTATFSVRKHDGWIWR